MLPPWKEKATKKGTRKKTGSNRPVGITLSLSIFLEQVIKQFAINKP